MLHVETHIHSHTHTEPNHKATPSPKSHGEPSNEVATIIRLASHHDTQTRPANSKPSEDGDTCKIVTHHHLVNYPKIGNLGVSKIRAKHLILRKYLLCLLDI